MENLSPSYPVFRSLASRGHFFSLVKRIDFFEDPSLVYERCRSMGRPSVLLESARVSEKMGRYSIVARDPFLIFSSKRDRTTIESFGTREALKGDPLVFLAQLLWQFHTAYDPGLLPFAGGAIGYFGYEVKNILERRLPRKAEDDLGLPDIYLLFFDEGVVIDHALKTSYLFSVNPVGGNPKCSYEAALEKLGRLEGRLKSAWSSKRERSPLGPRWTRDRAFPRFGRLPEPNRLEVRNSTTRSQFMDKVKRTKFYIRKGDIYQANLSQRFSFPIHRSPLELYRRLKQVNPSAFFGFLDALDFQIVSGSPERLVKLENGTLETRPIAGTRSRGRTVKEDSAVALDLILDEKERAEHLMLVDLERNDMGRIAEYGSVCVDELMVLEDYSHVKHIVSNVRGALRKGLGPLDVLRAFFPGGTITGTPKIRSMEVIDELEPVARGPYTGSLGYLSFAGNMDLNILIRSLVVKDQTAHLQVGAGIVADSVPEKEYDETLHKAEAIFSAVFGQKKASRFLDGCRARSRVS